MLEIIGGPDRDRTDDLFHAMEARSQLRHRPTTATSLFSLSLSGSSIRRALGGISGSTSMVSMVINWASMICRAFCVSPVRRRAGGGSPYNRRSHHVRGIRSSRKPFVVQALEAIPHCEGSPLSRPPRSLHYGGPSSLRGRGAQAVCPGTIGRSHAVVCRRAGQRSSLHTELDPGPHCSNACGTKCQPVEGSW